MNINKSLNLYTVYDKKAGYYLEPVFSLRSGLILRNFIDVVNQKPATHPFSKYPNDFALYQIGFFDQDSAEIDACKPVFVTDLSDLIVSHPDFVVD